MFQVAKAVSHSLNNCVNCLPGQKDVDMALKSIGEASKKLLIETVRVFVLFCFVFSLRMKDNFGAEEVKVKPVLVSLSDPPSFQVLPGGPERAEPNGRGAEPVGGGGGPCLQRTQQPAGSRFGKVQPRL